MPEPGTNLAYLQANAAGLAKRVQHNGRAYLVAPFISLVPGVLNNELVPPEEVAKYPEAWNGRPIVLRHPQKDGQYISANSPDILAMAMGQIHNAQWDGGRLKWENWYDIERCQSLGGDYLKVLERVEAGLPNECSTGYWRDVEPVSGTWQGKSYSGIARNIRPDHFANLLEEPGACSWADGCGGPRINQKGDSMLSVNGKKKLGNLMTRAVTHWISEETTRQKVVASLAKKAELPEADFEKALAGQLELDEETARRVGSALGIPEDEITKALAEPTPAPEPVANTEKTLLSLLANMVNKALRLNTEDSAMTDKCKLIDGLIANGCKVKRESLEAMDESTLQALGESFPTSQPEPAPEPTPEPPATNTAPPAPALPEEITTLVGLVKEMGGPDGFKNALATIQANTQNERAGLVSEIVANSQMTEADLEGMRPEALRKLAQQVRPAHYFRPMPQTNAADSEYEPYTSADPAQNGK